MRAATIWLDERLAEAGIRRRGEVTAPHVRPWGTVLKADTDQGPVWLKAPAPETAFEIRLYDIMRRIDTPAVLRPIALDLDNGWVLLPDGGTTLGDSQADLAEAMEEVLPHYARLQRDLMPHVDDLLRAGVTGHARLGHAAALRRSHNSSTATNPSDAWNLRRVVRTA